MSRIVEGLDGVLWLIDDVVVFGRDKEEHDKRLTLSRVPAKIVGGAAWADISGVAHIDVFTPAWKL